uniref:Uncharacterized protein n=1 Tax=Arundo donax TaxID=35708 RepID=A0A0A8ZEV2_ARUDO
MAGLRRWVSGPPHAHWILASHRRIQYEVVLMSSNRSDLGLPSMMAVMAARHRATWGGGGSDTVKTPHPPIPWPDPGGERSGPSCARRT